MIDVKPRETIILEKYKTLTKKDWLKMINCIDDPFFCDALIVQLEARRRELESDYTGSISK